MEKSDVYVRTGHPCKLDFIRFGRLIGLKPKRIETILSPFMTIPEETIFMIERSFLDVKMKRSYHRIVEKGIGVLFVNRTDFE